MTVRLGVRALRGARRQPGRTARTSSTSTTARPPRATRSCSRSAGTFPLDDLGLEHYGIDARGRTPFPRDGRLRIADGLWVDRRPGRPRAPHPPGPLPGRAGRPDGARRGGRARLPRPAAGDLHGSRGGVGRADPRPGARRPASTRSSCVADFATTAKGYSVEAELGHVTIVVDRATRELVGAAMACPDASAAIHECVLAIKARVPVDVLAETIHAFPSTSRIFNGLFADALRELRPTRAAWCTSRRRRPQRSNDDLAVDEDQRRARACAQRAAGLDRLVERRRREDDHVRALAGHEPAAVELARARAPGRRRRPGAPARGRAPRCGPNGGVPAGQRGSSRRTASAMPGPRVERLDRRVGPEREDRAGPRERRPRVARRSARSPHSRRASSASEPQVDRLDARPRSRARRTGRGRPDRRAGRARRRGISGTSARRSARGVERGPDRGVADGVDLRRDPGRRRPASRPRAQLVGRRDPDAAAGVRRRAAGRRPARCRLEERRGPRARATRRRSSFSQPTRARPSGSGAERRAAAQPARDAPCRAPRRGGEAWTRTGSRPRSARRA